MTTSHKSGFSAIAAVVIAAVVIGGGAAVVSMTSSNDTDRTNNQQATGTADMQADNDTDQQTARTTFQCNDGATTSLAFTGGTNADLTLPSGEVVAVSRVQSEEGAVFQSSDGSVTFRDTQNGAVVERRGEVAVSGCVSESANPDTGDDTQSTSSADVDADVEVQTEAGAETDIESETEATTSGENNTEVDASAETDAQINVGAEPGGSSN